LIRPRLRAGGAKIMKITYTGRQVALAPAQLQKIETHLAKVGRLLDGRRECEAHVILSMERRLHRAEITVNYYHHQLVGLASGGDLFTVIGSAIAKLEKQALKARTKWRDTKRAAGAAEPPSSPAEAPAESEVERRVYRVNHHESRKPMTLDEALMQMDARRDYLVYRDANTGGVSVLIRRRDGNFDLVEG
jgi:putative sigma-54 modulation protein